MKVFMSTHTARLVGSMRTDVPTNYVSLSIRSARDNEITSVRISDYAYLTTPGGCYALTRKELQRVLDTVRTGHYLPATAACESCKSVKHMLQ
jgi:hypothetical protein